MLFGAYGVQRSQQEIAFAAGVQDTIQDRGSRIDQLAFAVQKLEPNFRLFGKFRSSVQDLFNLTDGDKITVGVEWQGRFVDPDENIEFDVGHFSLVSGVDLNTQILELIDPDDHSAFLSRNISIDEFEKRWWEDNHLDQDDRPSRSFQLSFILAPKDKGVRFSQIGFAEITHKFVSDSSTYL